ncbi:endogenous retrovirus group 3 member 1 Env polyprotein-like [Dromaius novaehollandiae]|uniref:endogenous retrovirus group 3 member 1 Env polyprotein-like n=1 Tax=Dromaius novaehollandiae TaxID=8790 RepID=UPI00312018D7
MHLLLWTILIQGCIHEGNERPLPLPSPNSFNLFENNEFVLLVKAVSQTFNLSHCWVCGGPLGLSSWPWTSTSLTPDQIVSNYSETVDDMWDDSGTWPIQFPAMEQYCLIRTQEGGIEVGESKCRWTLTHKPLDKNRNLHLWMWLNETGCHRGLEGYWSNKNKTLTLQRPNYPPYKQTCKWEGTSGAWYYTGQIGDGATTFFSPLGDRDTTYFQFPPGINRPFAQGIGAKKGHYWICGHTAYKFLPAGWSGICYTGIVRPLFFLLPETGGPWLGIKVYDNLGDRRVARKTRSIKVDLGEMQKWGNNEWPPERIVQHYGPATWNPNELISGAREPIYNLKVALEIITNKTADAKDLLTLQSQQMRMAILQHRMVLDYLLAEEGEVCGKLNISNCCLEIDDVGEVVLQLTKDIRKIAHVPVQTWNGWSGNLWSWLPGAPWVKQLILYLLGAVAALMFLPCTIPCFVQLIRHAICSYHLTRRHKENPCHLSATANHSTHHLNPFPVYPEGGNCILTSIPHLPAVIPVVTITYLR